MALIGGHIRMGNGATNTTEEVTVSLCGFLLIHSQGNELLGHVFFDIWRCLINQSKGSLYLSLKSANVLLAEHTRKVSIFWTCCFLSWNQICRYLVLMLGCLQIQRAPFPCQIA